MKQALDVCQVNNKNQVNNDLGLLAPHFQSSYNFVKL